MSAMTETDIRILKPGDEAALEGFLLSRLESSMFLLSNLRAAGLVDNGNRGDGTYAAAFVAGQITGAAAHFWNGNIILQDPMQDDELWKTAVHASGRRINGVLGPRNQVHAVHDALDVAAAQVKLDADEHLFKVVLADLIIPTSLATGQVHGRRAQASDLDILTGWSVAYNVEALGEVDRPELWRFARESVIRRHRDDVLWVAWRHMHASRTTELVIPMICSMSSMGTTWPKCSFFSFRVTSHDATRRTTAGARSSRSNWRRPPLTTPRSPKNLRMYFCRRTSLSRSSE